MDVREAAKLLGVHTQTVYNMLYDGRLAATKTGTNAWDIPYSSIRGVLDEANKRFEKEVEISKASEVLQEFYEKKLNSSKENLYKVCLQFVEAYEDEDWEHSPINIQQLEEALQEYKGTIGIQPLLKDMDREASRLGKEGSTILKGKANSGD